MLEATISVAWACHGSGMTRRHSPGRHMPALPFAAMDNSLFGETAHLAATLHGIVFRMNPAQLREQGQDLLRVCQALQGDAPPLTGDGSEPARCNYPVLQAPFAVFDNLAEQLDWATRRRFTLRAAFRALDAGRAARRFRSCFGSDLPRGKTVHGHTPGNFAIVARSAKLLGGGGSGGILTWLHEESEARGENRKMGFAA